MIFMVDIEFRIRDACNYAMFSDYLFAHANFFIFRRIMPEFPLFPHFSHIFIGAFPAVST